MAVCHAPLQAAVLQPRDLQCQKCHGADNALPGHALVNRQDNMTRSAQGWEQDSQALGTGKPPLRLAASGTGHSQLTPPLPMGSHRSSSPELCRAGAALRPCCRGQPRCGAGPGAGALPTLGPAPAAAPRPSPGGQGCRGVPSPPTRRTGGYRPSRAGE